MEKTLQDLPARLTEIDHQIAYHRITLDHIQEIPSHWFKENTSRWAIQEIQHKIYLLTMERQDIIQEEQYNKFIASLRAALEHATDAGVIQAYTDAIRVLNVPQDIEDGTAILYTLATHGTYHHMPSIQRYTDDYRDTLKSIVTELGEL